MRNENLNLPKILGLILVIVLVLPACSGVSNDLLAGTQWKVMTLDGRSVLEGSVLTMEFKDSGISGNAGCNAYGASYTIVGKKIRIKSAIMTLMACQDPGVMEQEQRFMALLNQVASIQAGDKEMKLMNDQGETLILLAR